VHQILADQYLDNRADLVVLAQLPALEEVVEATMTLADQVAVEAVQEAVLVVQELQEKDSLVEQILVVCMVVVVAQVAQVVKEVILDQYLEDMAVGDLD
jgi:hypothetical protein